MRAFDGFAGRLFRGVFVCGALLAVIPLAAQNPWTNLRTRVLVADQPLQQLDTLTILPPLLSVVDSATGATLDLQWFSVDNTTLRVDTAALRRLHPALSRLWVTYRVLPADLAAPVRRLDATAIRQSLGNDAIEFDYTPYEPPTKPWETSGLVSNGTYTRGLSFGNSQNLSFNSNLNLQINGRLGNDLELQAALSDNSIPLQPDGTTRQLQEFDRIFVQLSRKNTAITAGDYDLTRPQGYFSNYFKRLQGGMVRSKFEVGSRKPGVRSPGIDTGQARPTMDVRAAAAVSRGKFNRQSIAGQEGNQGPYRLQGGEGERFIIVLAGTERVYVDGQQMRRGLEDDYVIDYNLGEITFTPRRLISKDSRIIVEFEYAVQTYLRATMAANAVWQGPRSRFYLNAYAEQDGKNAGGAQELSPAQRRRLALVGDTLQNAYASGIDTLAADAGFDPSRVLYKSVDTLACGILIPVLVYSANADSARYAARFTEVPMGQGNYVQVQTAANGRVYRWVAPDPATCQPAGNFEPVVRLVAPESRQLFAAGAEMPIARHGALQAEVALSNRDLNRFSPLGDNDNLGLGGMLNLRQDLFPAGQAKGWNIQASGAYEFAGRQFVPLNPYRPAEFARDWNIAATDAAATEQWARGGISVEKKTWGSARYEFGAFQRKSLYEGTRHAAQLHFQRLGYEASADVNLLETSGRAGNSRFSRPKFDLAKTFFGPDKKALLKIGAHGERERNERYAAGADTLSAASFWYDLGRVYAQTPDERSPWQWGLSWMHRNDYAPFGRGFRQNTAVDEANWNGRWTPLSTPKITAQTLTWNFSWRQLQVRETELTPLEPQKTYLGRLDYSLTAWKGALALTTGYELGSGQSPRIEFSYIRVNPGEGQYTWVDRNRDSILQVDEMELAVFQDQADYVRIAVTTPDYVRTNNATLNQSLRLDPRLVWAQSKRRWQRALCVFSTQSNLQISRRILAAARDEPAWNPFDLAVSDTALVGVSSVVRNVLFVNRADPAWDASLAQADNRSRTALTTGFESRHLAEWTLHGHANLGRQWTLEMDLSRGLKENDSQVFDSRDYRVRSWKAGPKVTWLLNRTFRAVGAFSWQDGRNELPSAETARLNNWSSELTWNPSGPVNGSGFRAVTTLRAKATFASVQYSGQPNTAVAYAMLDGLQDGRNFLWSLNLDRQLSRSVQLSLNYEGRKTGENRVIHVGRAQVRAIF